VRGLVFFRLLFCWAVLAVAVHAGNGPSGGDCGGGDFGSGPSGPNVTAYDFGHGGPVGGGASAPSGGASVPDVHVPDVHAGAAPVSSSVPVAIPDITAPSFGASAPSAAFDLTAPVPNTVEGVAQNACAAVGLPSVPGFTVPDFSNVEGATAPDVHMPDVHADAGGVQAVFAVPPSLGETGGEVEACSPGGSPRVSPTEGLSLEDVGAACRKMETFSLEQVMKPPSPVLKFEDSLTLELKGELAQTQAQGDGVPSLTTFAAREEAGTSGGKTAMGEKEAELVLAATGAKRVVHDGAEDGSLSGSHGAAHDGLEEDFLEHVSWVPEELFPLGEGGTFEGDSQENLLAALLDPFSVPEVGAGLEVAAPAGNGSHKGQSGPEIQTSYEIAFQKDPVGYMVALESGKLPAFVRAQTTYGGIDFSGFPLHLKDAQLTDSLAHALGLDKSFLPQGFDMECAAEVSACIERLKAKGAENGAADTVLETLISAVSREQGAHEGKHTVRIRTPSPRTLEALGSIDRIVLCVGPYEESFSADIPAENLAEKMGEWLQIVSADEAFEAASAAVQAALQAHPATRSLAKAVKTLRRAGQLFKAGEGAVALAQSKAGGKVGMQEALNAKVMLQPKAHASIGAKPQSAALPAPSQPKAPKESTLPQPKATKAEGAVAEIKPADTKGAKASSGKPEGGAVAEVKTEGGPEASARKPEGAASLKEGKGAPAPKETHAMEVKPEGAAAEAMKLKPAPKEAAERVAAEGAGETLTTPYTVKYADGSVKKGTAEVLPPEGPRLFARPKSPPIWQKPPFKRGVELERRAGQNLHPNFPVIDKVNWKTGEVTSIKSRNLNLKTCQNPRRLYNQIKRDMDQLAKFKRGEVKTARQVVKPDQVTSKTLEYIVPHEGSLDQQAAFRAGAEYGKVNGIKFTIKVMRE
jgi:hypothetical protein